MTVKVDRAWAAAATAKVDPKNPIEALRAAYNQVAERVAAHGRVPVLVEVTVRVAPQ